jgi:hypothetical protein
MNLHLSALSALPATAVNQTHMTPCVSPTSSLDGKSNPLWGQGRASAAGRRFRRCVLVVGVVQGTAGSAESAESRTCMGIIGVRSGDEINGDCCG